MSEDYDKKFAKIMLAFSKLNGYENLNIAYFGEQFVRLGENQKRWIIDDVYDKRNTVYGLNQFQKTIPLAVTRTLEEYIKKEYSEEVWINVYDFIQGVHPYIKPIYEINLIKEDYIALAKYIHSESEKAISDLKDKIDGTFGDPAYQDYRERKQKELDIWIEVQKRNLEDMQDMAKKRFKIELNPNEITEIQKI